MTPTLLLLRRGTRLAALALLANIAAAQTAVWIAPGNLTTIGDWNDPANWSTGTVPSGSSFAVVINQVTPAVRNAPNGPYVNTPGQPVVSVVGGALPVITGSLTLGQLRFDVPTATPPNHGAVYIGSPLDGTPASVLLDGAGLGASSLIDVNVTSGSSLTFTHRGSLSSGGSGVALLTVFLGETTASASTPARLTFRDDTAISTHDRLIRVQGVGPAVVAFSDRTTAGNGNFFLASNSTVEFHNTANAGSAFIQVASDSLVLFDGNSTAASATIQLVGNGPPNARPIVRWAGQSSLGRAAVTGSSLYGAVEIVDQASADGNNLTARLLDLTGAATGADTTGRLRATTSILAPTSVIADDARTITLGNVNVQDLLLGSNTLQVASGYIGNIRDSGGAYLSAAGENLVGGTLLKTGSGTLTLNHPFGDPANGFQPSYNVFSGPTIVRGGSISLYNRLANVTVESGGILYGAGIISGSLMNQGRVNSSALVAGNFVQTSDGIYEPNFSGIYPEPFNYGLTVNGNAGLGGRLIASIHPNLFVSLRVSSVEGIILQAGSITGRFDTVALNLVRVRTSVAYTPTTVRVRFDLLPFASLATTPAGTAYGAYLDQVHKGHFVFPNNYNWIGSALTFATDGAKAAQTLDDLSPDRYGVLFDQAVAAAQARRSALDRAVGGNQALLAATRGHFFAEGSRRRLEYAAVGSLPAADSSTYGWLAGGAGRWGDWTAGAYLAAERTDLQDKAGTNAQIRDDEFGLFARFDHGPWFVHAGAGRVTGRHELRRFVHFTANSTIDVTHTATVDGDRTDLALTAGRSWRGRHWTLSPFAGLLLSRWQLDDFTETSNRTFPFDSLVIEGWAHSSRRARAGFEAGGSFWGGRVQPRLTVAWWHEFEADRSIPARLVGAPAAYTAPGRPAETDLVQANLTLDFHLGRNAVLYFSGGGGRSANTTLTSDLSAGVRWSF